MQRSILRKGLEMFSNIFSEVFYQDYKVGRNISPLRRIRYFRRVRYSKIYGKIGLSRFFVVDRCLESIQKRKRYSKLNAYYLEILFHAY